MRGNEFAFWAFNLWINWTEYRKVIHPYFVAGHCQNSASGHRAVWYDEFNRLEMPMQTISDSLCCLTVTAGGFKYYDQLRALLKDI